MTEAEKLLKKIKITLGLEADPGAQKFTEGTLKDGTIIKWEGELAAGVAIIAVSPEGEVPAPDGTWELADGTMITTVGGLVTEVVPPTEMNEDEQFNTRMKPYEDRIASMEGVLNQLLEVAQKQNEGFEAVKKENKALQEAISKQDSVNETILKGLEKFAKAPSGKAAEQPKNPLKQELEETNGIEETVETLYDAIQGRKA